MRSKSRIKKRSQSQKKPKEPTLRQRLQKRQEQLTRASGLLESVGFLLSFQDEDSGVPKELLGLGNYLEHVGNQIQWIANDIDDACLLIAD